MARSKQGRIVLGLGLLLIVVAFILIGANLFQTNQAERASKEALDKLEQMIPSATQNQSEQDVSGKGVPDYLLNPNMPMPVRQIDGFDYVCTIDIPSLALSLPVFSEYEYDYLRVAPCRYAGSVYTRNMVICAHNYVTHFGNLNNLMPGERVVITDMDGNVFAYAVHEITIIDPYRSEEFSDNGYDLTLFTCTLSGAERVVVHGDLVEPKLALRV